MNEQPSNQPPGIWKRPWKGRAGLLSWFVIVVVAAFILFFVIGLLSRFGTPRQMALNAVSAATGLTLAAVLGTLFARWVRHWRNLRRLLFGVAVVITLIALFYAEENLRGKAAWGKFKRECEAKGIQLTLTELAPPPVPDELNFAKAPVVASSYGQMLDRNGQVIKPWNTNIIERMQMPLEIRGLKAPANTGDWMKGIKADLSAWQAYYRAAAALTNRFPIAPQPGTPSADVLLALSKYGPVIEELREAGRRPQSRYPLTYDADDPSALLVPHLAPLKGVVRALQLRAVAELEAGQSEKALDDVKLMFRLAEAVRTEPLLISHLVRISMVHIALQPVWEGLADRKWSDAQLAALQEELGRLDFLASYDLAMRGEAACVSGIIDYLRRHRDQVHNVIGDPQQDTNVPDWLERLVPSGWFYQNQLRCARFQIEWYLPLADVERRITSPAAAGRAEAALGEEVNRKRSPYNFMEIRLLPGLSGAVRRFAIVQTFVDLARVACALERYRLAHGEYPLNLDALTPQFLATLPRDVIRGQSLHYARTENGRFVLYSIGWNESDDGGRVATREKSGGIDPTKGDWVWRY